MIGVSALQSVGRAAGERVLGDGPGPVRAAFAAAVTGAATAAVTYKLLRSDSIGDVLGTSDGSD